MATAKTEALKAAAELEDKLFGIESAIDKIITAAQEADYAFSTLTGLVEDIEEVND